MKLSIIIPAYNAAKYVERCVDSIISQNYPDIEIILVDDGSRDNTLEICCAIADKHECVRVLHKNNGGVSSSRNLGIDNASGEYLMFVDVDDYLMPDTLKKVMAVAEQNPEADFCVFGFERISRSGKKTQSIPSPHKFRKHERLEYIQKVDTVTFGSVWAKLYKREFINSNSLRFDTDIIASEDNCFNFKVMEVTDCFVTSDIMVYYYDVNHQGATAKFIGNKYIENARAYLNIIYNCIAHIKKENGNNCGYNCYADEIIMGSQKIVCYNTLFQIYNLYRQKRVRNQKKYVWLKRLVRFMNEVTPDWQLMFPSSVPHMFVLLYKVHPRCADVMMRFIFFFKH